MTQRRKILIALLIASIIFLVTVILIKARRPTTPSYHKTPSQKIQPKGTKEKVIEVPVPVKVEQK